MCFLLSGYGEILLFWTRMICTGYARVLRPRLRLFLLLPWNFGVVDGLIIPHLKMNVNTDSCTYLNKNGRCSIHPFRPGFCRLFPLGRYYENDSFHIFSRLTNVQNPARQRSKSVNGLMSRIFKARNCIRLALLSQTVTKLCYDIRRQ